MRRTVANVLFAVAVSAMAGALTLTQALAQASVRVQSQFVHVRANYTAVTFCHGFDCHFETDIRFRSAELERLREIMATGSASPAHEREAIKQAVVFFEVFAARTAGTATDIAGNYTTGGDRSQLDCVDEARNTTRLLILLERKGLLKHHTVARIEGRGNFLDTRYPHNTAVVRDMQTGVKWSIDSWMRHNGHVPEVMTLKRWFREGYS